MEIRRDDNLSMESWLVEDGKTRELFGAENLIMCTLQDYFGTVGKTWRFSILGIITPVAVDGSEIVGQFLEFCSEIMSAANTKFP